MKWAPVPGCEGLYEVSDKGVVRTVERVEQVRTRWGTTAPRLRKARVMKLQTSADGYVQVVLSKDGRSVKWRLARLVLTAFKGASVLEAGHKNHRRTDNRLKNLEWVTRVENELQKQDPARNRANAVLTRTKVAHMRRLATRGFKPTQLAAKFGCHPSTAARACKGTTWA